MRVILLQDVPKLGQKYDIKEIKGGHARNFLIPRKLVEIATPKAISSIAKRKEQALKDQEILNKAIEENAKKLNGAKITIKEKANEKGGLFAQVQKEEIVKAIKDQKQIDIPTEAIELKDPIKEIGEYKIKTRGQEFTLEIASTW